MSKKSFDSFSTAAHNFVDNYRQISSEKSRNLDHTNRSVLHYAMLRKSTKPLRMTNVDLEIDNPHYEKIFDVFKNDIEPGKEGSDYLATVQLPFLVKEGDSGVAFNFVTESSASSQPFKSRAQRKEIKKNKESMKFSEIFTPITKNKNPNDDAVYLILKGVTDVSYHLSVEDDNSATFDIPNIRNMLYDGYGRLIISPGDEIFLFAYDNFLARVTKVFKGYIKNVADNFDGTYYSVSLNLADYTWKLRNIHFNLSPGNMHIERIFGYPTNQTLKDKMDDSLFMNDGEPVSYLGTYTLYDWNDAKIASEVSQHATTFFGGEDLASALSIVLTGISYTNFVSVEKAIVDMTEADNTIFYKRLGELSKINSWEFDLKSSDLDTITRNTNSLRAYLQEAYKDGTFPGMGYNLASNFFHTYAGRNQIFLDFFNSNSNSELSQTRVPEVGKKISQLLQDAFEVEISKVSEETSLFGKTDNGRDELLADREAVKYLIIEPEVIKHTSYVLSFSNFKEVFESEYVDVFSFFKNLADQAGLLLYSDSDANYRLETIHCNDFPSAIITPSDVQSWNFNEDVDGYISRMDVTTNSSLSAEDEGNDLNRLRWAMTVDFDIFQKYGYKAAERTFTSGQPFGAVQGSDAAFENGLALSMIASRKFLQMQNGRILGGNITIHPIPNLRLNTTVYIKPRNMIYTVMAIDDSASNESASRSVTLALAFGRQPGRFYEGMFYSLDTELGFTADENDRLAMIEKVRIREWQLWARDKNTYTEKLLNKLIQNTKDFSDDNLLKKVRERYTAKIKEEAKQLKNKTVVSEGS